MKTGLIYIVNATLVDGQTAYLPHNERFNIKLAQKLADDVFKNTDVAKVTVTRVIRKFDTKAGVGSVDTGSVVVYTKSR